MFKQGAMFGFEGRVLRKQFGKLFLTSLRRLSFRLVEGQQATCLKTSKGAMFGLDARIALAIFGALSVISGAALYSAIQEAKVISLLADMNEVSKAQEAYLLDTGQYMPFVGSADNTEKSTRDLGDLKSSSVAGWSGPYLSYETEAYRSGEIMLYPAYGKIYSILANDSVAWGGTIAWNSAAGLCTSSSCFSWTLFSSVPESIAKALDKKVDGVEDGTAGNLKWKSFATGYDVFLKNMAVGSPL